MSRSTAIKNLIAACVAIATFAAIDAGAQTKINLATQVKGNLPAANQTSIAASTLLGRGSAGGAGAAQQITLGTNLSMSGTTLNAAGGGGSGCVPAGSAGQLLTDSGAGACTSNTTGAGVVTAAGIAVNTGAGLVTVSGSATLTGKTMSGASNTFTNIPLSGIVNATAAQILIGRQSGSAGAWQEITLGTNLSISGQVLNATASGTGDVVGPASATADNVVVFNGTTGKLVKDGGAFVPGGTLTNTGLCTYSSTGPVINCNTVPGTGITAALSVNTGSAGAPSIIIAKGTSALGTGAVGSGTCASAITTAATGAATADVIGWTPNADLTAVTGYAPTTNGSLIIRSYATSGNVNFRVCNNTAGSITPGAVTLNWIIVR